MLSRVLLMEQASFLDSAFFDFGFPFDDGCVAPEVGIGGRDVVEALAVAVVVVMIDTGPAQNAHKLGWYWAKYESLFAAMQIKRPQLNRSRGWIDLS